MKSGLIGKCVVAVLMFGAAGAANAAVYDATTSFNGTSQGGAFAYGTSTGDFTTPGTFTPFSSTSVDCAGAANFLCANDGTLVPGIGKVVGGGNATFQTVDVPSGTLWVHPGMDVESEIVFTAPIAGDYSFAAQVGRLDTTSNGNGVLAFYQGISGTELYPNYIYGADNETLYTSQHLKGGQQIAFAVNNNGEYTYDSTAVNLDVTGPGVSAVPEPSTWALMIVGIGGIGLMLRRAKKNMGIRFKDAFAA